jgi:uncharacterized protein YoxC
LRNKIRDFWFYVLAVITVFLVAYVHDLQQELAEANDRVEGLRGEINLILGDR